MNVIEPPYGTIDDNLIIIFPSNRTIKQYKRLHNIFKTRKTYRRKEFHKKTLIQIRSRFNERDELKERLIHSEGDNKILTALELAAQCQHFTVKEFDWRFATNPGSDALQIMEELIPEVEKYLENHNTENLVSVI